MLHSSVLAALGRGQRPLCLGESVEGTAAHSCTRGSPRTDSTILRIDEPLSSSTRVREDGSLWSRQLRWLDSRQPSLAKAKARPVNRVNGTSDATSLLDKVSVNRVILGGERERGANERIQ